MAIKDDAFFVAVGAVILIGGAWYLKKQITAGATAVNKVVGGAVVGIGSAVGIPATDQTQCQQDIAAGKTLASSFSCPATDFLSSLVNPTPAPVLDTSVLGPVPTDFGTSKAPFGILDPQSGW